MNQWEAPKRITHAFEMSNARNKPPVGDISVVTLTREKEAAMPAAAAAIATPLQRNGTGNGRSIWALYAALSCACAFRQVQTFSCGVGTLLTWAMSEYLGRRPMILALQAARAELCVGGAGDGCGVMLMFLVHFGGSTYQ